MPSRKPAAPKPPLVYIDSSVYLDLITKETLAHPDTGRPRWEGAKELFDAVNADRVRLAASALIEAEVCSNGKARNDDERIRGLLRGWFTAESTVWTDVDRFLARDAARLAHEHATKRFSKQRSFAGADATHMAAAIRLGCDYLITQDGGFPLGHTIEGVDVIRPKQVWETNLLDLMEEAPGA